ncbi:MAG: hypothetical protein ACOYN0_19390 [Phycisphaerales bacterium]
MLFSLSHSSPRVIAWLNAGQTNLVQRACELAGLSLVGAGSPETGQTGVVAAALGCKPCDDLRAAMVEGACDAIVLLALSDGSAGVSEDVRAIEAAHAKGVRVLSLEPVVADLGDWHALNGDSPVSIVNVVRPLGLLRRTKRFHDLEEILRDFGALHSVSLSVAGPREEGSLAARLISAIECMAGLIGEAASVSGALSARSMRSENRLRSLSGDCAATIRTATGQIGAVLVCDRVPRHDVQLTLRGEGGVVRFETAGLEWIGSGGVVHESTTFGPPSAVTGARLLADEFSRHLYPGSIEHGPVRWGAVLATAQAILLSAATGQVESPETIRRMNDLGG